MTAQFVPSGVSDRPATDALSFALADRWRNLAALVLVLAAFGVATVLDTSVAYYGAGLTVFAVWMAWFVLVAIDWLRVADF
jgi:hypothetical protein